MGRLKHECIVVHDTEEMEIMAAYNNAIEIFNRHRCGSLVSPIILTLINGGGSFFIAPDGSKEGWQHSEMVDVARYEFLKYLKTRGSHWVCIELGGDDGHYRITDDSNKGEIE